MSDSGAEFLDKKSALNRDSQGLPSISNVLVVDDESIDADRMLGTLRVIYGYDIELLRAATLKAAIELVMAKLPDIIFLDDILKPSDDAGQSIPLLRRAGYAGPIIIISGQVTKTRRQLLLATGADGVIHKDDVDSVKVREALIELNLARRDTDKAGKAGAKKG